MEWLRTGPAIHIEDVGRFYRIYAAAAGHPSADQLQHEYQAHGGARAATAVLLNDR